MTKIMQWSAFLLALTVQHPGACAPTTAKTVSAHEAYEYVQGLRNSTTSMVMKDQSIKTLEQGVRQLQSAIAYLDEHAVQDLAYGYRALYYRGLDVRLDLAKLYVGMGQVDNAVATLEQIGRLYWYPGLRRAMAQRKILEPLEKDPRVQALLKVSTIPEGLYANKSLASAYTPTLTSAERAAGVSMFWLKVREDFVFFDNVTDLDWGKTYLSFLEKAEAAKSTEDYYRVLMQLAPLLKDGHTNVYPPEELSAKFYAKPPLRTALIEDKVIVTRIDSEKLRDMFDVGAEIVEIDGIPVQQYAETVVAPFVSSSTPQDRIARQYGNWLLNGDQDKPVRLRLKPRSGASAEVVLPRKGYSDVAAPAPFAFRLLPGNIAYISMDHFDSEESLEAFERAFPEILKANGLIIDVRNNGGGESGYGTGILVMLTNDPLAPNFSYRRRDSGFERNLMGNPIEWSPLYRGKQGEARSRPSIFTGPVVVLTGPKTFSAAEDFVADFQGLKRGKTIGGATGGSTGQPIFIKLPGGGSARICAKRDTFADGKTFVGKGLFPDIAVSQTLADFHAGRDTVLERALAEFRPK